MTLSLASAAPTTPAQLLQQAQTIAVVGYSSNPSKPANFAPAELARRGWTIVPVNPNAGIIDGMTSYATLADIPFKVDLVDVFRPASEAADIARQAAAIGVKTLWLQKGIVSTEARDIAAKAGMAFVQDQCAGATAAHLDLTPAKG